MKQYRGSILLLCAIFIGVLAGILKPSPPVKGMEYEGILKVGEVCQWNSNQTSVTNLGRHYSGKHDILVQDIEHGNSYETMQYPKSHVTRGYAFTPFFNWVIVWTDGNDHCDFQN